MKNGSFVHLIEYCKGYDYIKSKAKESKEEKTNLLLLFHKEELTLQADYYQSFDKRLVISELNLRVSELKIAYFCLRAV